MVSVQGFVTEVIGRNGFAYPAQHVGGDFFKVGRHIVLVEDGRCVRNATRQEKLAAEAIAREARMTPATAAAKVRGAANGLDQADAEALHVIASMITDGVTDAAKGYADTLDTYCREAIPMDVWVYLGGELIHA